MEDFPNCLNKKKSFLSYAQKIKESIGDGKIIQEKKKNDAFDAEIYLGN